MTFAHAPQNQKSKKSKQAKAEPVASHLEILPTNTKPTEMKLITVEVAKIVLTRDNHRVNEDADGADQETRELAASIGAEGLKVPLSVWIRPDGAPVLVYGHRRLRAVKLLGWKTVPAIETTEAEAVAARAIENLQRLDLNPIEEAIAVADLFDEAQLAECHGRNLTPSAPIGMELEKSIKAAAVSTVGAQLGKSDAWVRDRLFLGTLDKVTRELVIGGKLPMEHARELAKIADSEKRADLARRAAIDGKLHPHSYRKNEQPMLLRELRDQVATHIRSLAQVAWPLDIPFAEAPACDQCPSNSRNQTGLFEDGKVQVGHATTKEPEAGVCLNAACYGRKSGIASRETTTGAKRITATVNGLPVKERDAKAVAAAIAKHQPAHVKPAAFKKAVLDHRERFAGAAKNKGKSSDAGTAGKPAKRVETAEVIAKRALDDAVGDWERDAFDLCVIEINKHPPFRALLTLVGLSDKADSANDYDNDVEKNAAKVHELMRLACEPSWTNFNTIAKEKPAQFPIGDGIDIFINVPGAVDLLLKELDITPKKPKPVLADFLPKAKAEPEGKKAAGGKPKAGKKGKAKAAKPAADLADDADEEGGEDE